MATKIKMREVADGGSIDAPLCPLHSIPMKFDPSRCMFTCAHEGCGISGVSKDATETGVPVVVSPPYRIYATGTTRYIISQETDVFIRLPDDLTYEEIKHVFDLLGGEGK